MSYEDRFTEKAKSVVKNAQAAAAELGHGYVGSEHLLLGLIKGDGETVFEVAKADGEKCERCWCYSKYVGTNHDHPTLCERCAIAVEA